MAAASGEDEVERAIDGVWRIESARLIAGLTRMVHDVGLAEELAQDSLVAALEQWPESGVPGNPGAWLMAVAKRRAIDQFRRNAVLERKIVELGRSLDESVAGIEFEPDHIEDDILRLIFISCHPTLPTSSRVALTLRLLGGLSTEEIARAFLAQEPAIAQRIVRAKKNLRGVPFEAPESSELPERLSSVLEVIYLIFNEGYSATAGDDWIRPALCDEALRVGRILAALMPGESEVHGLVALMEIQASRLRARTGPSGEPILLLDQNRALWDRLLITRGLAALDRASALTGELGPYGVQAAIAACHARARTPGETDWAQITELYDQLTKLTPSPVVELNRAVAVFMAFGPRAALEIVEPLAGTLDDYYPLHSVRGELLSKLGRAAEARAAFERAAQLTRNTRERDVLLDRARSGMHDG